MSTDDPLKTLIELSEQSLKNGELTLDEAFDLDEDAVKQAMRDNPDRPEAFVRDALTAQQQSTSEYVIDRGDNSDTNQ